MEFIPKQPFLQHNSDTLMVIRKEYNLEKPGMMEDAVKILREWAQKQRHFKKKDFSDSFLETAIIMCKGSVERAKKQLDRICTLRTLLPKFFSVRNVKTDIGYVLDAIIPVFLPKMTPDYHRVCLVKFNSNLHIIKDIMDVYVYIQILAEYMKTHDYCLGFYTIVDLTETNIMDVLTVLNPVQFRQAVTIFIEGYGMRLKGIHIFSSSKLVDAFTALLKQVTSAKIGSRIHTHKDLKSLADIVPLDVLPEEYGGKGKPLRTVVENWIEVLSTDDHIEYLQEMSKAGTDESYRDPDQFNEQCAGLPGTFRVLSVD